jgi:hypothetical protein
MSVRAPKTHIIYRLDPIKKQIGTSFGKNGKFVVGVAFLLKARNHGRQ